MAKLSIIIFVGFGLFLSCGEKRENDHSAHSVQENIFYTCSMDPQVKENKPGKCPICHMDLTPVQNDDTKTNELKLSDQQIYLGNITTQSFSTTQNSMEQKFTGVLTFDQEKIKRISARSMGRIEKLYFKTIGDYIKVNQPVYELYSEEIAVAKQDFLSAYQQLSIPGDFGKNVERILSSAKEKLKYFGLNEKQLENIKNIKEVSPYTTFYSTTSGYVNDIFVAEGSYVMEGEGILETVDLTSLWLESQVNANYSNGLRIGQKVKVSFNDIPGLNILSNVSYVNPEINPATRLLLVRMKIENKNLKLRPGMQGIASINRSNMKGLFIPADAIIREEGASYIWLRKSQGVYRNQMVETGVEINGMIEIKAGIDSLRDVVITGAYAINSEYIFRKGSNPMEGHDM